MGTNQQVEVKDEGVNISGPAHLVTLGTRDLSPKYVRENICLVQECGEDMETGMMVTRWYLDYVVIEGEDK